MTVTLFDVIILIILFGLMQSLKQMRMQLSLRILISMIVGIGFGMLLKITPIDWLLESIKKFLTLVGFGYLSFLKMLVIPLILTSIIHAILNLGTENGTTIKKMSFITCGMLLGMTAVASLIGLMIGEYFTVGAGLSFPAFDVAPQHTYTGIVATLLDMIPSNPVKVLVQENTIGTVILAVLLGISARMLDKADHDKMETFRLLIASLFAIIKKLANLVLAFTPYAILSLMSLMVLDQGMTLISGMINFIGAMYVAMLIVIMMHAVILYFFGYHPVKYFRKAATPLFVAFTTRSSFGTLPVAEETLRNNFKTSQAVATFVPSLGATIGMNACAGIFPAMLVIMTLHILQQPLTFNLIVMVMAVNAIASLGISGIPGTAYIAATVTLTSLNLPYAVVALVQGIDPIVDMGRTATNVNGAITTALIVNRFTDFKREKKTS